LVYLLTFYQTLKRKLLPVIFGFIYEYPWFIW
jgi:hypothetical protein